MRRIALLFLLCLALPALAQSKRSFTFEDMMALKRVEEPMPSPDGKWVVFGVVDVDLEKNSKTPHIWIAPLVAPPNASSPSSTSAAERQLISDQDSDRPRWAPDGKHFAFLSNKDGGSQVWIADFDTTTGTVTGSHKLTSIATEAGGELWSPDGKHILFTSDVYPECTGSPEAAADCNKKKLDEAAKSPVKAQIFTHLLYRHWNAYKEGKRSHIFVVSVRLDDKPSGMDEVLLQPRDLTPGDYDSPVFSLGGQDNYAFSPDGKEICYTSNHDKMEAASTNNELWIVPVDEGPYGDGATAVSPVQPKNITADNPASDSTPLYSPDGKYIAYRAQKRPGYEADRFRLMLFDRKTGEKKNLTEEFDSWIGTFTWMPDSKGLYFNVESKGEAPIYQMNLNGAKPKQVIRGFNDDLTATADGTVLLFTRMSLHRPNEILSTSVMDFASKGAPGMHGGCVCAGAAKQSGDAKQSADSNCSCSDVERNVVQVTRLNDGVLSQVSLSPLETFWFPGSGGDKVQGFLVKPPNFDASKKYPVKFLIHGGPQGAWGDDWSFRWNPELFAANGYVVIMINFHGSTGYGQAFIDKINGDWGGAPFEDLMKGLDYAEKTYSFIDKDRECALGASYGGYAINWILGHTNRFKCLVSHDGMFNTDSAWGTTEELWFNEWEFKGTPYTNREMYRRWSPHEYATNFKTPTLVVHGQRDYRLDVSEGFQLFTTLQRLNIPSKMLYFPDEGHWVLKPQNSRLWYQTVNDWVDQWMKK